MSKNLSELSGRKGLQDNLFDRLGQLTIDTDVPTKEDLETLAEEFLIGRANTYGAASFYDFLKPENKGKKVYVCNGSACLCAGTQDDLIESLQKYFRTEEIGHMTCLGRCHENSAFHYQGKNYSGSAAADLKNIVSGNGDNKDTYTVHTHGTPVLTRAFGGIREFHDLLQKAIGNEPEKLLDEIRTSRVRGRGGAGFPMASKLEFCRGAESGTKFIICNADEGDPGAYSDRYLLEERPHSVLFGMIVSGIITGAEWGVVYIRAEYPESLRTVQKAISELEKNNLTGKDILGSGINFHFKLIQAQGSYICGEETALINSIEGQRPEVRTRPPYPAQVGLFNKPTLVNNVETLATLCYILQNGGDAYSSIGTEKSSGTKLLCLDSAFKKPGLAEVDMGTPFSTVVYDLGGGFRYPVKALHVGGPLGGLVPVDKVNDLTIDFESFSRGGFLLGHASIVSIPQDFPMVKYLEHIFDFASYESCGKCFPCRLGTYRAFEMLQKTQNEDYQIDRTLFEDLLETLEKTSLCAHGGGIPLPVRNALQYFDAELKPHFA
jgi:NADH:ubiquinone oxidoreductase subunit F (NADH-binding)/NADH:ubiquinone oxidoreductase subunit E